MKKTITVLVLSVALVFAFAATANATSAKTWNYQADYYSWGSYSGNNYTVSTTLGNIGANPTNPGVHGNYLANTAKCGICHSVHRANASGTKLLNTATATCAGCHKAGVSTVTNVLVTWQAGGPHSSGTDASCNSRLCHLNNPHGAGASDYKIFAAKLINNETSMTASGAKIDASIQAALANYTQSLITTADLNAEVTSTWDVYTRRAVVVGYTCNSWGCHEQTMLTVLNKNYSEDRLSQYPESFGTEIPKTGHLTSAAATSTHASYTSVTSCTSCHDQTDSLTRTGFTFPHSETPAGASNLGAGRAYLWMGYAGAKGDALTAMSTTDMKAYDGACLKCHRDTGSAAGIGIDH